MVFGCSEDINHSVLTQIIVEQEGKNGQTLLPIPFLHQLIRFYGDSMQLLVPSYVEFTIGKLTSEQAKFRDKVAKNFGGPLSASIFDSIEEQTGKNMALFEQALVSGGAARPHHRALHDRRRYIRRDRQSPFRLDHAKCRRRLRVGRLAMALPARGPALGAARALRAGLSRR
jgi:hypothetical protein